MAIQSFKITNKPFGGVILVNSGSTLVLSFYFSADDMPPHSLALTYTLSGDSSVFKENMSKEITRNRTLPSNGNFTETFVIHKSPTDHKQANLRAVVKFKGAGLEDNVSIKMV